MLQGVELILAYTNFSDETVFSLPVWEFMILLYEAEKRARKAEAEARKRDK